MFSLYVGNVLIFSLFNNYLKYKNLIQFVFVPLLPLDNRFLSSVYVVVVVAVNK
jgi:hypothetical protein